MAHYVDNKKFFAELVKFLDKRKEAKAAGTELPRIPEYIGLCLYQIAHGLSTKHHFVGYTFRDEMISDGIENCILYIHNFDPEKTQNPFAYFTQIIYFAFLRRIEKEKKQSNVKKRMLANEVHFGHLMGQSLEFDFDEKEEPVVVLTGDEQPKKVRKTNAGRKPKKAAATAD